MTAINNSLPAAVLPEGRWWSMPIRGDNMAPTLNRDDMALVVPCHGYDGPAIYVLSHADGSQFVRRIELPFAMLDNVLYSDDKTTRRAEPVDREWVNTRVIGKIVGVVKPVQ